jgi:hypothetical protein
MGHKSREDGGDKQLPADLLAGGAARAFLFTIGDDLASARREETLKAIRLRVSFKECYPSWELVDVQLNGQPLGNEQIQTNFATFGDVPAVQGINELLISLAGRNEKPRNSTRIEGIELFVEYNTRKAN